MAKKESQSPRRAAIPPEVTRTEMQDRKTHARKATQSTEPQRCHLGAKKKNITTPTASKKDKATQTQQPRTCIRMAPLDLTASAGAAAAAASARFPFPNLNKDMAFLRFGLGSGAWCLIRHPRLLSQRPLPSMQVCVQRRAFASVPAAAAGVSAKVAAPAHVAASMAGVVTAKVC